MYEDIIKTSIGDLQNLLICSTPSDGPMVKGILYTAILGLNSSNITFNDDEKERIKYLSGVLQKLHQGEYNILPSHMES